jgi:hypothetical protein
MAARLVGAGDRAVGHPDLLVGEQCLAERGAGEGVAAVLDDRLAQLADRLVDLALAPPRQAQASVGLGEQGAVAGRLRDRPRQRRDRRVELAERERRGAVPDQRLGIVAARRDRVLEGGERQLGLAVVEPRRAEQQPNPELPEG